MLKRLLRFACDLGRLQPTNRDTPPREEPRGLVDQFALEIAPGYVTRLLRDEVETLVQGTPVIGFDNGVYGTRLSAGDVIETPRISLSSEHELELAIALDSSSTAPVVVGVAYRGSADAKWSRLGMIVIGRNNGLARELRVPLHDLAPSSSFRVSITEGNSHCFVTLFRICARDQFGRVNALNVYRFRMTNEVGSFSGQAYTHRMYGEAANQGKRGVVKRASMMPSKRARDEDELRVSIAHRLRSLEPTNGETAYGYAMRALGLLLPLNAPNYFERIARLSATKPLRILSILAGAARIEQQLIEFCKGEVDITLLDASPDLIERAAGRLSSVRAGVRVDCLIGDINAGLPGAGEFDIIVCVSALHHVANLEDVLFQINERLAPDGEFWNIGEQIGRNGNRLWPGALAAANEAFGKLPERLRKNAHTGRIDTLISDRDFSRGCFEGIRSEELEPLLEAYLVPEHVFKRNSFLWRLVDATYSDNFDLAAKEDLNCLHDLVAAEAIYWSNGGRSTEMHAVFRKKYVLAADTPIKKD
jgi:SAM-dependent methyltransferase